MPKYKVGDVLEVEGITSYTIVITKIDNTNYFGYYSDSPLAYTWMFSVLDNYSYIKIKKSYINKPNSLKEMYAIKT